MTGRSPAPVREAVADERAGAVVAVSIWRLVVAAVCFLGWGAAMTDGFSRAVKWADFAFFSQIAALASGSVMLGALLSPLWNHRWGHRARLEGRRGFLRGAVTSYELLIAIAFPVLLDGNYQSLGSKLEHLVIPVLLLIDWTMVGRNQQLQWWWPIVWVAGPLAYLPLYISASRGDALYDFLDPATSNFLTWVFILLIGFLLAGYLVWTLGQLRRLLGRPANAVVQAEDSSARTG